MSKDKILWEDNLCFIIKDAYPVNEGHMLVISKRHIPTWFHATIDEQQYMMGALDIAKHLIERDCNPQGYNIGINCGSAAGQTIDHLHIHLIPRYLGDIEDPCGGVRCVIPERGNYKKNLV